MTDPVLAEVDRWLQELVIGLNLCPFAKAPYKRGLVRVVHCASADSEALLQCLTAEAMKLRDSLPEALETTVIAVSQQLKSFGDYNDFLDLAEGLLHQLGFEGELQLASFHPNYCFAGCQPQDAGNLTNCSPYPLFHLIREASLSAVLARFPDSDSIVEGNIAKMEGLSAEQRAALFPYAIAAAHKNAKQYK